MKITEIVSITELSRLLGKSRPTVYKYVSDFESGNSANLPHSVKKLFLKIQSGEAPKREIYQYCQDWFVGGQASNQVNNQVGNQVNNQVGATDGVEDSRAVKKVTLKEIIRMLKQHEKRLDFKKIKQFIEEEIKK